MVRTLILLALAVPGLYISAYFTLAYFCNVGTADRMVPEFCRPGENACRKVLQHRDARVFGIPNSILGILYYILVIVLALGTLPLWFRTVVVCSSWITVAVAAYLVYSLLYRVRVRCALCLSVHCLNVVLWVALIGGS